MDERKKDSEVQRGVRGGKVEKGGEKKGRE